MDDRPGADYRPADLYAMIRALQREIDELRRLVIPQGLV